jgi:hypothetical protein
MMAFRKFPQISLVLLLSFMVLYGTAAAAPAILTDEQEDTLNSLEQIDDYPLYTMHYYGAYDDSAFSDTRVSTWGCSLFAAFADPENKLYGRNFDWEFSPALLLFTDPPDGYASVSMVDIAYLGFPGEQSKNLTERSLEGRTALLYAPFLPFDGMNERGLAVGMAAVAPGNIKEDPNKETIDSLGIIREMLDHAATVDEALEIINNYNIDFTGGPPLHYLIADASGQAILVEFFQGEMVVTPNESSWHMATNFIRASAEDSTEGICWRYDILDEQLIDTEGRLTIPDALALLKDVSQSDLTQWSIVYSMSTGAINVVMGEDYDQVHTLQLELTGE